MSTFISSSVKDNTNFFSAQQLVCPAPAGLTGGESLIAFTCSQGADEAITATGWTRINAKVATGVGPNMTMWSRTHDATATSYTFGWAAPITGIIGGMCAFSGALLASQHGDGYSYSQTNPPGSFTGTLLEHTATIAAEVVYAYFAVSAGAFTTSTLTMPIESTVRESTYWVPADVGTKREIFAMATEEITGATEPARDTFLTWGQVGATVAAIAMREVPIEIPSAAAIAYDFWG